MRSALDVRGAAVVAAPVLAALLIGAGFLLDPAIGESGRELAAEYAAHPGREQVSALSFHFAFALLAIPAVVLIVAVRGRGAWLANVAAFLAFLGMTTLPGFLLTDFYDIAIYGELGGDSWEAVDDRFQELPGATVMFLTGFLGFALTLPVALLGRLAGGLAFLVACAAAPRRRDLRRGGARWLRPADLGRDACRARLRAARTSGASYHRLILRSQLGTTTWQTTALHAGAEVGSPSSSQAGSPDEGQLASFGYGRGRGHRGHALHAARRSVTPHGDCGRDGSCWVRRRRQAEA